MVLLVKGDQIRPRRSESSQAIRNAPPKAGQLGANLSIGV
jgi:hypothetical protein